MRKMRLLASITVIIFFISCISVNPGCRYFLQLGNEAWGESYDSYTKALLHFDGTDGSTQFVDACGKTVNAYGNTQISTAQSKFGVSSGCFDGSGDYLTTSDSDDWYFGSKDFTIDFQVRFSTLPSTGIIQPFVAQFQDSSNRWSYNIYNNSGTYYIECAFVYGGTVILNIGSPVGNITVNTWYHLALVRCGNIFRMYKDGTQIGTDVVYVGECPNISSPLFIAFNGVDKYFNGYIDEFRISKGIARWTSNFTPPDQPYLYKTSIVNSFNPSENETLFLYFQITL